MLCSVCILNEIASKYFTELALLLASLGEISCWKADDTDARRDDLEMSPGGG